MAFTLGAMGSARTNFYISAFSRAGFDDVAAEVQRLWVDGDKPAAIAAVPDQVVLAAYAIGTDDMVTERIRSLAVAGVDAVRLGSIGRTRAQQRTDLEMAIDLVRSATAPAEEEMRSAAVGVSRTPIPRRLSRLPRRR